MTRNREEAIQILETRTKRLPNWSYKLAPSNSYGMDVAFSEQLDIDEGNMSVWIPFADGNRRDGVGDLLEVTGINTERHRANPIVLFDHGKQVTLPVALAEDRNTKAYTVVIDPVSRSAKANAFFYQGKGLQGVEGDKEYDHALFCQQLFDLICKGYVRAGSIGYQVINAREMPPDFERGTPKGLHLLAVKMLEVSAVVLPANGDTVRKALDLPSICGKPISPILVKSLSPYLPEITRTVTGYTKDLLPGGKGDDAPQSDFDDEQLQVGIQHELEHTEDEQIAREIAMDHLTEDPDYYRKLQSIEKAFPSDKVDPEKACQILRDGEANGQPLSQKQRGMFGAACGKKAQGQVGRKGRFEQQPSYDREEYLRQAYNRGAGREGQDQLSDSQVTQRMQQARTTPPVAKKPGVLSQLGKVVGTVVGNLRRKKEMASLKSIRLQYRRKSNEDQQLPKQPEHPEQPEVVQQQQEQPVEQQQEQPGFLRRHAGKIGAVAAGLAAGTAAAYGLPAAYHAARGGKYVRRGNEPPVAKLIPPSAAKPNAPVATPFKKSLGAIRASYRSQKNLKKTASTVGGAVGGLAGLALGGSTMSGAAGSAMAGVKLGTAAGEYLGSKLDRVADAVKQRLQSRKKSQFAGDLNWLKEEQEEVEHKQPSLKSIRMKYRTKRI